jgi:hypothetical protein
MNLQSAIATFELDLRHESNGNSADGFRIIAITETCSAMTFIVSDCGCRLVCRLFFLMQTALHLLERLFPPLPPRRTIPKAVITITLKMAAIEMILQMFSVGSMKLALTMTWSSAQAPQWRQELELPWPICLELFMAQLIF